MRSCAVELCVPRRGQVYQETQMMLYSTPGRLKGGRKAGTGGRGGAFGARGVGS
jgi:hypothetical protein